MSFNKSFCKSVMICTSAAMLFSCNNSRQETKKTTDTIAVNKPVAAVDSSAIIDVNDTSDNATLYLTVADTGQDYFALRTTMFEINKRTRLKIDTMNRYYNTRKKEIVLSDTDEDEIYRGEYFPRRFPGENLSLEYYSVFDKHSTKKNIALVAGIYETQKSADSMLSKISQLAPHGFTLKAVVYTGCMH